MTITATDILYCTNCGEGKPKSKFSMRANGKPQSWCRGCAQASSRAWVKNNPERAKSYVRKSMLSRKYGITPEEYDQMFEAQRGGCRICGGVNDSGKMLHVDHHHETGKIRGLTCFRCNAAIGLLRDDPELARKLATYLEEA